MNQPWTRTWEEHGSGWPTPISHTMSGGAGARSMGGVWEASATTPIFLTPPGSPLVLSRPISPARNFMYHNQNPQGHQQSQYPQPQFNFQQRGYDPRHQSPTPIPEPPRQRVQQREEIEPVRARLQPLPDQRQAHPAAQRLSAAGATATPAAAASAPRAPERPLNDMREPARNQPAHERPSARSPLGGRPPLPGNDGPSGHEGPAGPEKKRDYFEVLGVERDCTEQELKKAYKRLAVKLHPDKNPNDPHAQARFAELSEAFSVLSDPAKREEYAKETMGCGADAGWGWNAEAAKRNAANYQWDGDEMLFQIGGQLNSARYRARRQRGFFSCFSACLGD